MKKLIYSLILLRAEFKIYEIKKNKEISYLTEIKEEVCFNYGGEMKITTFINETFRGAVGRLRIEVGSRVENHAHLVNSPLPF